MADNIVTNICIYKGESIIYKTPYWCIVKSNDSAEYYVLCNNCSFHSNIPGYHFSACKNMNIKIPPGVVRIYNMLKYLKNVL